MEGVVIDVSACMPWCCEDEANDASDNLLQLGAKLVPLHVPSLWPWEMMNAVAVANRRGRITPERARQFFELIAAFDFRVAPAPAIADFARISALAARLRLTAYDAAYLDLALQLKLPLATLDEDLKKAAFAESVRAV